MFVLFARPQGNIKEHPGYLLAASTMSHAQIRCTLKGPN